MNSFLDLNDKIIFRDRLYIIKCIIKGICIKCYGHGIDFETYNDHLFDNDFNHNDMYICRTCQGNGKFKYQDYLSFYQLISELSYLFDQYQGVILENVSLKKERLLLQEENKKVKELINFR